MIGLGADLNRIGRFCDPARQSLVRSHDAHRQIGLRAGDGTPASHHVSPLRSAPPWRTQSQAVLAVSINTSAWPSRNSPTARVCATSKRVCVRNLPSCITWGSATLWRATLWRMPMPRATGASIAKWHRASSPPLVGSTPTTPLGSI